MSVQSNISDIIKESISCKQGILNDELICKKIEESVNIISNCFKQGNRLWLCGNGGSAADAQHIAAEFSGRFYIDRPALPAEALHVNASYLSSVSNDYSFAQSYSRMIEGVAQEGDVLIAISTSGNSENIVAAAKAAKSKNIKCIGLSGQSGGELKAQTDVLLNVPSTVTPRIQETHILIGHIICELVEKNIFHA